VFTRTEVETLISNPVISPDRRVLYGVLFLTGMRFGEAAALHWSDLDLTLEPLGRLLVHKSYCFRTKREKPTKTEQPRSVPVHPTLARILKEWWSSGWKEAFGRSPTTKDLILPPCGRLYALADGRVHRAVTNLGARAHRNINRSLRRLREDLVRVGHSPDRRVHDTRRTFVSLVQAGGARKDILRWVTHGPTGDIMDLYTTLPWPAVCAEVAKLDVRLGPEAEGKESAPAPGQASKTLAAVDGLLRSALDLWLLHRDAKGVRRLLLDILSQMETFRS